MQKIYVLLRNDQQTGPYSLEEIIQFDLKPYDLIWIQGRSAGWYYPQEIAALHPYLSFLPKKAATVAEAKPPFVAPPVSTHKEESPVVAPSPRYTPEEPVYKAPLSSSPAALEEAVFAQFQQAPAKEPFVAAPSAALAKKRGVSPVLVGITTVLIVGSVFTASWMLNRGDIAAAQTLSEVVSNFPVQEDVQAEEKQATVVVSPSKPASQKDRRRTVLPPVENKRPNAGIEKETATISNDQAQEMEMGPVATPPDGFPATIHTESEGEAKTGASETAVPGEKKKKLRDKIFDIFRKKPEETKQEETSSAETVPGERTATRRDVGSDLAQLVHVRFIVPNEWMMGIHGAKATLVNRSSETIQKATIEVQYFDDDNQLLQKKMISFEKVGEKESKTIPIPDHPTATRVDYSVISASGKPAA
ncbi:hypothetical protein HRG84_04425 [Flavisolibacter sp. BT320]|nr:hypothetical protein [Flavisolibacter longurius]